MPFVHIRVAGPALTSEQIRRLQTGATDLMADTMRKKRHLTAVLVEEVPASAWSVGDDPVRAAAHLDVKVTAGTNTPAEKARFIAEAMQLLRDVLGQELNPVGYVIVHELAGTAWGYDGVTQAARATAAAA
jgi:4-oxalocrotonate tautomerase